MTYDCLLLCGLPTVCVGVMGEDAFLDTNHHSEMLANVWCWYRLAKRKCMPGGNRGPLIYDAKVQNHLDVLLQEENTFALQNPIAAFHYLRHKCDKMGCHGECPHDALTDEMNDDGETVDGNNRVFIFLNSL